MIHSVNEPGVRSLEGEGRDVASTRDRILDAARELFHRQGYRATSIGQIRQRAGASASSVYHFFPSKEDLLVAVAESYEDLLWPMIMEPAHELGDDPLDRVLAIFEVYRRFVEETDFELGCPVGNLAVEIGESVPAARAVIARTFGTWKGTVERWLAEALPETSDGERAAMASLVLTLVEGALVHARAERSLDPFTAAAGQLRRHWTAGSSPEPHERPDASPGQGDRS